MPQRELALPRIEILQEIFAKCEKLFPDGVTDGISIDFQFCDRSRRDKFNNCFNTMLDLKHKIKWIVAFFEVLASFAHPVMIGRGGDYEERNRKFEELFGTHNLKFAAQEAMSFYIHESRLFCKSPTQGVLFSLDADLSILKRIHLKLKSKFKSSDSMKFSADTFVFYPIGWWKNKLK